MATAKTAPAPVSTRITLTDDRHALELTKLNRGATIRIEEGDRDAASFATVPQLVEIRAALSTLIDDTVLPAQVVSDNGKAIAEGVRRMFSALIEHEKTNPGEVIALYAAIVAHVRSAKPFVLREVVGG